jgi:predicted N-acetyltransferase YhbS
MATEIRGLTAAEMPAHAQLVYESYHEYVQSGERPFLSEPDWWLQSVRADPYYEPPQTRVMFRDGRMVAGVTCYTREVYADGRQAKVGCIGSVCTHPDFRRQGLVREILAEAVTWMEQSSYHWSSLYGREEVYGGSGWSVMTSLELIADVRLREGLTSSLQARPADPDRDAPLLADLYERFNQTLTGPIVRSEDYWNWRVLPGRFGHVPVYTLLERNGQAVAYYSGDNAHVRELAWVDEPEEVIMALLALWPGQPVRFSCFATDMIRYLRDISEVPTAAAFNEHPGGLTLPEAYKGLWRYIGDPNRRFREIVDTPTLKRFLREHEYNWWPADGY